MQYEEFMRGVTERTGLDREQAEIAVTSTLTTLAERIHEGEATDLASELPSELKPPLEHSARESQIFPFDEFVRRVGQREGVAESEAREHARAVMATVRDAVTEGEFRDVAGQLPDDYSELIAA